MKCREDEKTFAYSGQATIRVGLVGNPNCGKTTLFNALTGASQRVGNWPGVTVERKTGLFQWQEKTVAVVDLPGVYALSSAQDSSSIDERIATEYILQHQVDCIINILDASNLERNLYLTLQLLEMRVPMLIVVNMMDIARQRGMDILLDHLAETFGCVVVPLEAHKNKGIKALKQAIVEYLPRSQVCQADSWIVGELKQAVEGMTKKLENFSTDYPSAWLAIRLLEEDSFAQTLVPASILPSVLEQQNQLRTFFNEDPDILLADARYRFIEQLMSRCLIKRTPVSTTWTARIDRIVLNRILGLPIFFAIMYSMFFFAINLGGAFQDFFDISSSTIFVEGLTQWLTQLGWPAGLIALLANGVGKGINTTLTFIPVIGAMFLFLAFLEDSGYMARAAFVVDRVMGALGLPGKSFVPMIIGFGCNVPAVMATRTLENKRDRILTVMMSPFISCGARLAIYTVFTAAFFPTQGQNIVFALYLIGIGMAMLTGLILRKTLLKGDPAFLVMELPLYHLPQAKTLFLHTWQRLRGFVLRAGKLIIPICVLIGVLNAMNMDGSLNTGEGGAHSILSTMGRMITPLFAPMGIQQDNWPATVSLMTGVLAKEVVIGTLNAIYLQVGHLTTLQASTFDFWQGLHAAVLSIPANLGQLGHAFSNPILATAPVHTLPQSVYGVMYQQFDGKIGAMAYLLFVLLYFPCVSTTAAMLREVNRAWTFFSVVWTTVMAYGVAVVFYQLATVMRHPVSSLLWVSGVSSVFVLIVWGVHVSTRFFTTIKKADSISMRV